MKIETKIILKTLATVLIIYVILTLLWNFTNEDEKNKPSHIWGDWEKEGYTKDPLHDRKE